MNKVKRITGLLAAMLCMAVFLFPVTAFAMTDTEPPTITASISGDMLNVKAVDNDSGVEAVFVNGNRFNYLVNSGIDIPLNDCAGKGEYISVYAVDFAGNQSKTVQLKNPYYSAPVVTTKPTPTPQPEQTPQPTPTPTPEPTPQPDPIRLTPEGNLTLVDDIQGAQAEDKQFITVITKNGNYFYLIIDRAGDKENVHFLNMVDEADLLALIEDKDQKPAPVVTPPPTEPTPEPTPEPQPEKSGGMGGVLALVLIVGVLGGGAFYYFKVLKPKQAAQGSTDFDELDFEDEDGEGDIITADSTADSAEDE